MRYLLPSFIILLLHSILFVEAQSTSANIHPVDSRQKWIQSILREHSKPIKSNDYIFYCTGHHGINWSLIANDSSGIYLYNGSTRKRIKYDDSALQDSLSFINDNILTIKWGFDSLANAANFLKPLKTDVYNPVYQQIYLIKDNKLVLSYNDIDDYYAAPDSVRFNSNIHKLVYLMFWLSAPSARPYMPVPQGN